MWFLVPTVSLIFKLLGVLSEVRGIYSLGVSKKKYFENELTICKVIFCEVWVYVFSVKLSLKAAVHM